ncbi:hypothetical protein BC833DRAFT_608683 [Globomyces pollinis-pini]|nr:hypothetical protein BC833DRAFT_608683 [Globomyces pollinis-pini]
MGDQRLKAPLNLKDYWYPISLESHIKNDPVGLHLLGHPIVLFRSNGQIVCLTDKCSHRSAPLSLGKVVNGNIECMYHGWQHNAEGSVVHIPSKLPDHNIPSNAKSKSFPVKVENGLVWICIGNSEITLIPPVYRPSTYHDFGIPIDTVVDLDIDHSLMIENLMDPAHLPFTHDGTLSNRSLISPMTLEFQITKDHHMFGTNIQTKYPDEKSVFNFYPPCHVILDIEVSPGWKLALHFHCVPIRPGHMRLIFRSSRNFMQWINSIPGFQSYQQSLSRKIVFQDYELLHGQSLRLQQKANPWNSITAVDMMPKTYRSWFKKTYGWFAGYGDIEDMATDGCIGCGDTDSFDEFRYTRQEGVDYSCYEKNKPKKPKLYLIGSSMLLVTAIGTILAYKYAKWTLSVYNYW